MLYDLLEEFLPRLPSLITTNTYWNFHPDVSYPAYDRKTLWAEQKNKLILPF